MDSPSRWDEGRGPTTPIRCSLTFGLEGALHRIALDASIPAYFSLSLCYLLGDDGDTSRLALLQAANDLNRRAREISAVVDLEGRAVYFTIDGFGTALPSARSLARMLRHCALAADLFFTRLRATHQPVMLIA